MTGLLEAREYLKSFYSKYEIYVNPALKFLIALISLIIINSEMGYMETIKNPAIVLVIALICSFMPQNFIVIVAAFFVLFHAYALAIECAIVTLAVFVIMFLMYLRFAPKDTLVVLFTPLLFACKIPFVMPVAMGLLGGPVSVISVSCGVVIYYVIKFMTDNVAIFSAMDAETSSQKLRIMLDGILDNKGMMVTVVVFVLTLLVVYAIRRLSIDYAWSIAVISGIAVSAVLLLICEFMMELQFSVVAIVLGGAVSLAICIIIQFLEFNVDYNRTEIVQFEDDEYYYYVKAVPKNIVSTPEKKIKRINKQHKKAATKPAAKSAAKPVKQVSTIKTAHGVSRTTVNTVNTKKNKTRQE